MSLPSVANTESPNTVLTKIFIQNHPNEAVRIIEAMPKAEACALLLNYPTSTIAKILEQMAPGLAESLLVAFPLSDAAKIIENLDAGVASTLLSRLSSSERQGLIEALPEFASKELNSLLEYPEDSIGHIMRTKVIAFNESVTIGEAIQQMQKLRIERVQHLYLIKNDMRLAGQVDPNKMLLAKPETFLGSISSPITQTFTPLEPKEELADAFERTGLSNIPIVDIDFKLMGVVNDQDVMDDIREDLTTDMQTMVGVSKDERALSSSFFAVRKRQPWLQINLVTAFLAAAVVAMFEGTIAKYTALAILLPIAAGQSGNAGAQALAVTMRGLTLREISMRHWFRVLIKEASAGLINGLGIAITCSIGVYIWSQSIGLALVLALSMIISMTIAGIAGAIVPILLKRFGLDPAQSSSIVLTTITDIAGFMSFLGIATMLSGMLV